VAWEGTAGDGCSPGMSASGAYQCALAAEYLSARLTARMRLPLSCQDLQQDELLQVAVVSTMPQQPVDVCIAFNP
jgi:hypothetical protein